MTSTNKFVICQPRQEDYLCEMVEGEVFNSLGWHAHPRHALTFDTIDDARRVAQRICDNKGYRLLICELYETETQLGVFQVCEVAPGIALNLN
jgi:hypothetical protein